jgi:hypothetical protein
MAKVYISSTFRDLREYRQKVRDALSELGYSGVAMESYVAESKRPVEKCLADVAACDIYIGVFAWRYGWIPDEHNPERLSITNLEYNEAVQDGKNCFIFFLDQTVAWPLSFVDADRTRITTLRNTASERHGGIPFTTPDDLKARVATALYTWAKETGLLEKPSQANGVFDKDRYFADLRRRYQRLDLEGLTPPDREEYLQITLRSVFVEPAVRADPPPSDIPKDVRDRIECEGELDPDDFPDEFPLEEIRRASDVYYRQPPKPFVEVLTSLQRQGVVILGDPGSGKSTLVKYLILSLIDPTGDTRLRTTFESFLPVLIELRSYVALRAQHKDWEGFLDFLEYLGKTEGFYPEKRLLDQYLKNDGRALVVFDGLDEVFNPDERRQIARQIVFFKDLYPQSQVIVTSRIVGYSRKVLDDAGFRHFTLQELAETEVVQFVMKWYDIAFGDRPDEGRRRAERILEAYRWSSSVRQLAGNPMLLTIMAIIGKHQELPRDRWKLYDHAATVLIQHWDVNKYLSEHARSGTGLYIAEGLSPDAGIDFEDKYEMLRRLAFKMQGGKGGLAGNYIRGEQLHSEFTAYLKDHHEMLAHQAKAIAQVMMLQFSERNFILSLYGANVYGFVHRAFLEFFCATAFINQFEKTQRLTFDELQAAAFGKHWKDQSWHEVLRLICGMLDPEFAVRVVQYLAEQEWLASERSQGHVEPPWNLALAVQCLGELRNLRRAAGASEVILRRLCAVFDEDMRRRPRLFAFMRDQVVSQASSIAPGWPRNEALAEILREREPLRFAYIYDHLFGTFIGAVGRGSAAVHNEVVHYAEHKSPEHRVLSPFALACGWRDDAETLPRLRALAEQDRDRTVRYAALYALAEHYAWHADTLPILRWHAVEGPTNFERAAALSGLGKHYNTDRDVFKLMCREAIEDRDKFPRTVAVKGLGEFFRNEPDTLALLLKVAREDSSPDVGDDQYADSYYCREAAVSALARYWPREQAVLKCLTDVSQADTVEWMRTTASNWLEKIRADGA